MRRQYFGYAMLFIMIAVLGGCSTAEQEKSVETVPILQYAFEQNIVQVVQWDLGRNEMSNGESLVIGQEDYDTVTAINWDGADKLILPAAIKSETLAALQKTASQITKKESTSEIVYKDWRCWQEAEGTIQLNNGQACYTLDVDARYTPIGLIVTNDEAVLLLRDEAKGETALYHYQTAQQTGTLNVLAGPLQARLIQIEPLEKAVVEHAAGFYITDGFDVYDIETETDTVRKVFSKNDLADAFSASDAALSEGLAASRCTDIGIYNDGLLVQLTDVESADSPYWLFYQVGEKTYLTDLSSEQDGAYKYLLPDIANE